MTPEKIDFRLISLKHQKVNTARESYIELHEKHFVYRLDFDYSIPKNPEDEALGWIEESNDLCITAKKESVILIERSIGLYGQHIVVLGLSNGDTIKIYFKFKDLEGAEALRAKLTKWFLS